MSDKKSSESRRKLLKSIMAGSGAIVAGKSLPESWSRPVVDSVMLPAHALTSGITIYSDTGLVGVFVSFNEPLKQDGLFADIAESLIPVANAGEGPGNDGFYACAMVNGETASVAVAGLGGEGASPNETQMIRRGTLNLNGSEGTITAESSDGDISECLGETIPDQDTRPARIVPESVSATEIAIEIMSRGPNNNAIVQITVPLREEGCLPEPPLALCE
jgi:hypothetical protein